MSTIAERMAAIAADLPQHESLPVGSIAVVSIHIGADELLAAIDQVVPR